VVVGEALDAARRHGWQLERLTASPTLELVTLRRAVPQARWRLYLSAGIHGDEPAGPLAVQHLLRLNPWPEGVDLWLCPCLNPSGFPLNRRENAAGQDLNRDYRHRTTPEVRAHVQWLERQPRFDLTLCLHEDWEAHGFYLYELNPDEQPSLAEAITEAVGRVCPVDPSPVIDERAAHRGIIRPQFDPAQRPQWPEAFYLITQKTRHSYTLEAPSDFALSVRVTALVTAVRAVLEALPPDGPDPRAGSPPSEMPDEGGDGRGAWRPGRR
jgi:predicted deacylase